MVAVCWVASAAEMGLPEKIPPGPVVTPLQTEPSARQITVVPRSYVSAQARWQRDPRSGKWIAVIDRGVNLIVEGVRNVQLGSVDVATVDVATDRMVIWTENVFQLDQNSQTSQPEDVPLEVYMEGNIVFREGERIIHADRMYYDVNNRIGIVLDAEMLTPAPDYEGWLRLKAEVLQQVGPDQFLARESFITSSRMGRPGYRIQTDEAYLEYHQTP
ncbi:MAG: hypothetical protein ACYTG0_24965, partial [Planctomycetota bacterium]